MICLLDHLIYAERLARNFVQKHELSNFREAQQWKTYFFCFISSNLEAKPSMIFNISKLIYKTSH